MISSSKQHTKGSTNGNNAAWSRQSDWVLISLASNQAWRKFFKSSGDKHIYSGINIVLHLLIFGCFQGDNALTKGYVYLFLFLFFFTFFCYFFLLFWWLYGIWGGEATFIQGHTFIIFAKFSNGYIYSLPYVYSGVWSTMWRAWLKYKG